MTIDNKLSDVPKCFRNGQYHYRTVDKEQGKNYCALSDDSCKYYESVKGQDLCMTKAYQKGDE